MLPNRVTRHRDAPFRRMSRVGILERAQEGFLDAGRALELSVDPELWRLAKVAFRLASRCRTDRRSTDTCEVLGCPDEYRP